MSTHDAIISLPVVEVPTTSLPILPSRAQLPPADQERYAIFVAGDRMDLNRFAQDWFSLDIANGDATENTVKQYIYHFNKWLDWCAETGLNPGIVTEEDVMRYRRHLVQAKWEKKRLKKTSEDNEKKLEVTTVDGYLPQTIQLRLVAMRRFYHSAHKKGFIPYNPVEDVKAPRDRRPKNRRKNFSKKQVEALAAVIPTGDSLKAKRDRAMITLMFVEGIRRISVSRASVEDLTPGLIGANLYVRGKGKDYTINISEQSQEIINTYLMARGRINADSEGEPLLATVSKWGTTGKKRMSTSAIYKETVALLEAAEIKEEGKACHALRHTCGHLLWLAHKDLKMVQNQLGHDGLEMAGHYSQIEDAENARISESIPVDMRDKQQ